MTRDAYFGTWGRLSAERAGWLSGRPSCPGGGCRDGLALRHVGEEAGVLIVG